MRRPHALILSVIAVLALLVVPLAVPAVASAVVRAPGPIAAPTALASAGSWAWPTDAPHRVLRPFIAPASDYGAGHRGVDLAAGTALLAPADGVVHFAGVVVDRGVLSIDQTDGVLTSFESVTTTLHAGDAVHRGERIGTVDSGHCATPCLHLGARVDGVYVSPMLYLGGLPRAVLLPTRRIDG